MAEHLRTGVIEQQQRAATRVFEGRPVEFFPHNVSLPPPADKPRKQPKTAHEGLELRALLGGPHKGRLKWQVTLAVEQQIEQLLAGGMSSAEITRQTGVSYGKVRVIKERMPAPEQPVPRNHISDEQVREIWRMHDAGRSMKYIRTSVGRASETVQRVLSGPRPHEPAPAETAPALDQPPPEAPAACTPAPRPSAEGQRLGVLEWAVKFAAIEFDGPPVPKCKPRKTRAAKAYARSQVQMLVRSDHAPSAGMDINAKPRALTQSIAQIFAGESF